MPHEVTQRASGQMEMAALSGVRVWWEGNGLVAGRLEVGASIDDWVKTSGMDFLIRKAKISYQAGRANGPILQVPDKVCLYRNDNNMPLGVVGSDYNVVQPYEVLEFFRELTENSGFQLTTAGALFGGSRYWALAEVAKSKITGWDEIGAYLLLSTSADGSMATEARKTTVCVVCNNTLRMAFAGNNAKARVSHRLRFDQSKFKVELGLVANDFAKFLQIATDLSKAKIGQTEAEAFVLRLLAGGAAQAEVQAEVAEASAADSFTSLLQKPLTIVEETETEVEEKKARKPRGFDQILGLYNGDGLGSTRPGRAGTAWGLLNAVTEYVDHHATAKTADHRFARSQYGSGDALKVEALDLAQTMFA